MDGRRGLRKLYRGPEDGHPDREASISKNNQEGMIDKLIKIQSELKAPKNLRNKSMGYTYRSCEDILEAVKPLLAREGLVLTLSDEIVEIGGRNYVKATASLGEPGGAENIPDRNHLDASIYRHGFVTAYAREEETKKGMDGSQITGAASSYARKYALNGLFLIDDAKDSDSTNTHGKKDENDAPAGSEEEVEDSFQL